MSDDQVSVQIPQGALPGMQMKAQTPDGRSFTITIPADAKAGMTLKVTRSAEGGSIATLDATSPPPVEPPAGAPEEEAPAGTPEEKEAVSDQISVQIPHGALPGMQIKGKIPDGRSFTITVPAGAKAGMTLLLSTKTDIPTIEEATALNEQVEAMASDEQPPPPPPKEKKITGRPGGEGPLPMLLCCVCDNDAPEEEEEF